MRYVDVALVILESTSRPVTSREITEAALRRGLIKPVGKTPEATISAELYLQARDDPNGRLGRLAEPGPTRAQRLGGMGTTG